MRRSLSFALLLALVATAACRRAPAPPQNLLLIVIDCLRADHVGANGYARPTTPHLDALAREGVDFRDAFAEASWTRPSVPTLLTALYPSEHGLLTFDEQGNGKVESPALAESVPTIATVLKAAGYRTAMIGEQFQLAPQFGLARGFDVYTHKAGKAETINRKFLDFAAAPPAGAPFFAYLHYLEIHWPYCPPEGVRGKFETASSSIAWCSDWRQLREDILSGKLQLSAADMQVMQARYDEELLALDGEIGKLFDELKQRGLWDTTTIVVTADHGEEFFEHGLMGHGQSLYDELLHVPLIVKPAKSVGGPRGVAVDALLESRRIAPTLAALGGAKVEGRLAGPSLLPWLTGHASAESADAYVVAESSEQISVRSRAFKLIADRKSGRFTLYDLAADPGETHDATAEHRRTAATLRGDLKRWLDSLHPAASRPAEVDKETVEGLRSLGYVH